MGVVISGSIDVSNLHISVAELAARLKMPKDTSKDFASEYINRISNIIKPRYCYAKTSVFVNDGGMCDIGFAKLPSVSLGRLFKGCNSAYVMAVTLGLETDIYINRLGVTSSAESFVADAVASSYAEAAMDYLNNMLKKENKLTPRFSPGFGDFELKWQQSIVDFLRADNNIGIKLGANYIMAPRKSVTAIAGVCNI